MKLPDHLSYSSITQADACLAWYKAERIDEAVETPSMPREVGKLVHSMIELHLSALANGETEDEATYQALLRADTTRNYEASKAMFYAWRKRFAVLSETLVAVEEYMERELPGVPKIIGYPDVVYLDEATLVARDEKTGWGSDVNDDYAFQGDLMAWMLKGQYPTRTVASEVEFVRPGIVKRREFDDYAAVTVEQRVRRVWAKLHKAFTTSIWPATPGKHCGFCPIAPSCAKASLAAYQGDVVLDDAGAAQALVDLARLEAAAKRIKSALKDRVDASEAPIESNGLRAGFVQSETLGVKDVKAFVERVGAEKALPMLTVNGRAKGFAAIKKDAKFADLFGVTKTSNTFKISGSLEGDGESEDSDEAEVA